jgi:hypothetical protein
MTTPTLDTVTLQSGGHETRDDGMCLLEAVAWFANEPHSDSPRCASPVLSDFGISINDSFPDDQRQKLVPFIPRIVGTRGDGKDEARGYLALDWLIRVYTPAWLRLVPALTPDADILAGYGPIETLEDAAAIGDAVRAASANASAARSAVWSAAESAAWSTAESAAGAAARSAAWSTAEPAAGAAARSAAWSAAESAAWSAAGAAAGSAAWSAAESAAWSAARSAAESALAPTVAALQDSAIDLFDRMLSL